MYKGARTISTRRKIVKYNNHLCIYLYIVPGVIKTGVLRRRGSIFNTTSIFSPLGEKIEVTG
jgi:hypothetical protein